MSIDACVSYATLPSYRGYTWVRWFLIIFPQEIISFTALRLIFFFSDTEFLSILQAAFFTFYIICKKSPTQTILPLRQKQKPLFIISKDNVFTSGVCSSISFTALSAVNSKCFSSTWEQKVVFYWFFKFFFSFLFWKGWKSFLLPGLWSCSQNHTCYRTDKKKALSLMQRKETWLMDRTWDWKEWDLGFIPIITICFYMIIVKSFNLYVSCSSICRIKK